jgi:hypothetical protein
MSKNPKQSGHRGNCFGRRQRAKRSRNSSVVSKAGPWHSLDITEPSGASNPGSNPAGPVTLLNGD